MAILTLAQVREHIETDLGDDPLTRLIDDADQEIIDRLGVLASQSETLDGGDALLHLRRKALSITSAVERILETDYTLASNDFELLPDGFRVQRKQGTNYPYTIWRGLTTIVYVPADETASRKRLLVDLVKLAVAFQGVAGSGIGDARIQHVSDYQGERNRLFDSLRGRNRRMPLA